MNRLADLYDAVMEDPDYLKANEELDSIKSTLVDLVGKGESKSELSEPTDDENEHRKRQPYKPSEEILNPEKKTDFDMGKPHLHKVISKLKKLMIGENTDQGDKDEVSDDRISVRVMKIREKSEDFYGEKDLEKSIMDDNHENKLAEMEENEEMRQAAKKMENIVRKQLEDAGVNHEG